MARAVRVRERFGLEVFPLVTTAVLVLAVAGAFSLWAAGGPGSRDILVTQLLINVILVMGLQVFIGNTGILSFGHLAFGAITGYTVAILSIPASRKAAFIPDAPLGLSEIVLAPQLALVIGVLAALGMAVAVGAAVTRVGGLAATIITLAMLFGVHEVALNYQQLTGGGGGLSFVPRLEGRGIVIAAAVLAAVLARWFRLTLVGRWAQAGQEDALAANACGIDVRGPWFLGFMLSVLLVAVGSGLRVQVLGSISPNFFYFSLTILTLAMLVVGGRRSVTGALVGVVLITVGNEVTRTLAATDDPVTGLGWLLRPGLSDLFLGGAMVGFMLLRPDGLLGDRELDDTLRRWWRRRRGGSDAPPPTLEPAPASKEVAILRTHGVTVRFGGFTALSEVALTARSDEVLGLIGPNGAGKTTLLNVITGVVPSSEGRLELDGHNLTAAGTTAIARAGLARTFQNLRLFPTLSVRENVAVAAMSSDRFRAQRVQPDVDALLAAAGLWEHRQRRAGELDYGSQRRLEIARAAALAPAFLLLDEPTSGMSDTESALMIRHVRDTAAAIGAGVIVIDHDLHFITGVCDRIVVLDHGEVIATGSPTEIQRDPAVIEAYLGAGAAEQA